MDNLRQSGIREILYLLSVLIISEGKIEIKIHISTSEWEYDYIVHFAVPLSSCNNTDIYLLEPFGRSLHATLLGSTI